MFRHIVWATDGSQAADLALPYAKSMATDNDATLHVVHCVEHVLGPRASGLPIHPDEDERKAKVHRQVTELASEGVKAEEKIVGGRSITGAGQLIAEAAREVGADVIVVGTRGHTPLVGLVVGGVTQRLLHVAPCPVLAVPAGPRREREREEAVVEATAGAGS